MDTFPSIEPIYAVTKNASPPRTEAILGDGYGKLIQFGLNLIKPDWSLEWSVSRAEASTIELFLETHSADGEWFYWTPPDGSAALRWRCDEWTVSEEAESRVRVSASFKQVFELILPELTPDSTACFGPCGESTSFNPYQYTYARAHRTGTYRTDTVNGIVSGTIDDRSPWFILGDGVTSKYYLEMNAEGGNTAGWDVYSNYEPKWRSTIRIEYNGTGSTLRSGGGVSYFREIPGATFMDTALPNITVYGNGPAYSKPNLGELLNLVIIWEFSNDMNAVAATWNGYRNSFLLSPI